MTAKFFKILTKDKQDMGFPKVGFLFFSALIYSEILQQRLKLKCFYFNQRLKFRL